MFTIKQPTVDDIKLFQTWWNGYPAIDLIPMDSTFIVEYNSTPVAALSMYFTNCQSFCLLENLVGNPQWALSEIRKDAINFLINYVEKRAKQQGFKRVIGFTTKDALVRRYQDIGYEILNENLISVVKEL